MRVSTMACANIPFLSTPSGWRATLGFTTAMHLYGISIHALRVEGDFYKNTVADRRFISIHALRVEGDSI